MPELDLPWPLAPIRTERLTLRDVEARDHATLVELQTSPEVRAFLGGPRERVDVERDLAVPRPADGRYVVELDGAAIGTVTLDRRDPARPGRVRPEGGDVELSYLFRPTSWGRGYATEAVGAVLDRLAVALPGEAVVVCTQVANAASLRLAQRLGFVEVERFEEFGEQQWLGVLVPSLPPTSPRRT